MLKFLVFLPVNVWLLDMVLTSGIRPSSAIIIPIYTWLQFGFAQIQHEKLDTNIATKAVLVWLWPLIMYRFWFDKSDFLVVLNEVEIGVVTRAAINKEILSSLTSSAIYLAQLSEWIVKGIIAGILAAGTASLVFWAGMLWLAQNEHALLYDLIRRWSSSEDILYYSDVTRFSTVATLTLWLMLIRNKFKDTILNSIRISLKEPALGNVELGKIICAKN